MQKNKLKIILGMAFLMFSLISFSSDKTNVENNEISDGIVSGKREAIDRVSAIFDYTDSSIYEIYSKINYLTTLRLQEGEKILFFAGGDTERWAIEEIEGGKGNRPLVFIKPNIENPDEEDMFTNINIVTDKHIYFINVRLDDEKYNPLIEWRYPNERKILLEAQEKNTVLMGIDDLTKLNYNYRWNNYHMLSPIQVLDNGTQTFLVMKDELKETPAVYVKGTDGEISLVNVKINGKYMILDRTTKEIILEIGKQKLKIYNDKK